MPKRAENHSPVAIQKRRYNQYISFPSQEELDDFRVVLGNIKMKTGEHDYKFVRRLVEEYGVSIGAIKKRERE